MTQTTYTLKLSDSLGYQAKSPSFGTMFVGDGEDADDIVRLHLDALIRSGDYCAELATRIDDIAHAADGTTASHLEEVVRELLYIQNRYVISRKPRA